MKKLIFFLLLFPLLIYSQNHYVNVLIDNGKVLNIHTPIVPVKMGLGVSFNYLIPSYKFNYYTLSTSIINYPHVGQSYSFSHFNNGIDDAFHYAKFMLGYRVSLRLPEQNDSFNYYKNWNRVEGLSFEPRIGFVLYNFSNSNPTWILSPKLSYIRHNIELSMYIDYCSGSSKTNLGYNTFQTVGFSMGYNFKL